MPYLNLDPNFFDHPKTRRLIGRLGPMADVLPLRLWAYCARVHPSDGAMRGYTELEVEGVMGWHGEQKAAVRAMTDVGFLLHTKRGFNCVDWHQHQGHLEAFRRRGIEAAKARWKRYASSNAPSNACKQSSNAPSTPAVPNQPITNNRKTSPSAVDFSKVRITLGSYKNVYVTSIPLDECRVLLRTDRLGTLYRNAIEWWLKTKPEQMTGGQRKAAGLAQS